MISPEVSRLWLTFMIVTPTLWERTDPGRLQARRQFYARLEMLHEQEGRTVSYDVFRFEMVKLCKEFLRKN